MATNDIEQSETMTLRVFDGQDDSLLGTVQNIPDECSVTMAFDYLQECADSLENKNSEVNLPPVTEDNIDTELQLDNLCTDYKGTDFSSIEFNFVRIENMLLQGAHDLQDNSKDEAMVQEGCTDNIESTSLNCRISFNNRNNHSNSSNLMTTANYDTSNSIGARSNEMPGQIQKSFMFDRNSFSQTNDCSSYPDMNNENNDSESRSIISLDLDKVKENSLDMLDKHFKPCSECSMTFRYKRHLDRHLEGHRKNNCLHCNAKFARRKHLEVHLYRSHGERVTKYPHSCDVCPRSFPKRILLNRHRAKHDYENGKVCPECGQMLEAGIDENEHKKNDCTKKRFQCESCLQMFSIEQTYLTHIQNHDNYKCSECDVTFASKKKAHEHYKLVHSPKIAENKMCNSVYSCIDCRHTFLKKDDYSRHLESTSHLNKVDREIPARSVFTCSICSKKLISQRALDQHIRRTHKGEKRFTCNIYGCVFQCSRRTDLSRHKQLHVEQRNIVCEQCGKTFTSVSILNDHVLYVHNKERQFVCEECGKAFKRNSLLKRHKLSHQQYRPFACMQCSTAFKRSHHLTRHMETCHRITLEKKKKVVKLMRTEDGRLVPIPEKPKKLKSKKIKTKGDSDIIQQLDLSRPQSYTSTDTLDEHLNSSLELQPLFNPDDPAESLSLSEFTNLLPVVDSAPQVLSLVDINSGQVVTVEVTNPETLAMNNFIDQFETNCNEILRLPGYQDLELQTNVLNNDQNFYDHGLYSDLSLSNVDGTSLSLDSSKIDSLPAIENDLSHSFPGLTFSSFIERVNTKTCTEYPFL